MATMGGYYWNPAGSKAGGSKSMASNAMGSSQMESNPMGQGFMMGPNPFGSIPPWDANGNNGVAPSNTSYGNEPLVKMLIPFNMCGYLFGNKGSYIQELRKSCKGRNKVSISFSDNNQVFPGTNERICLITGTSQQLVELTHKIMERLKEKYEAALQQTTRILITPRDSALLIGKGGTMVNQIQGRTGVKMSIGDKERSKLDDNSERIVSIIGSLQQRSEAMKEIITLIAATPANMANTRLNYDHMPMGMPNSHDGYMQDHPFDAPGSLAKQQFKGQLMSAISGIMEGSTGPSNFNKQQLKEQLLSAVTGIIEGPQGPALFDKQLLKEQLMSAITGNFMDGTSPGPFDKQQLKQQILSAMNGNFFGGPQHNFAKKQRMNPLMSTGVLKIDVPFGMVGYLLGRGGEGINEMTRLSNGAKFELAEFKNKSAEEKKGFRVLTVTGDLEQVTLAHEVVQDKVEEYRRSQEGFF